MRSVTRVIGFVVLSAGFLANPLFAQTPPVPAPDFSGIWTMDRTRSESAMQEQAPGDTVVTIAQLPGTLKVETLRNGAKEIAIYPIGERPDAPNEVSGKRRAYLDGSVLVDEGSVDISGQTIAFREERTRSEDGTEMVVETTVKIEHGYELKGAQTIVTGKNVYVRNR